MMQELSASVIRQEADGIRTDYSLKNKQEIEMCKHEVALPSIKSTAIKSGQSPNASD